MNDTHVKVIRFDDENKDEALMHFGIKDMHWGVRRYQNPDGSLTSLGRQHYGVGEARKKVSNVVKKFSPSEIKRRNKVLADSSKKVKKAETKKVYGAEDKNEYSEFFSEAAKQYSEKAYEFLKRNKDPDKWENAKNDPNYKDFMNLYIEYGDHIDEQYKGNKSENNDSPEVRQYINDQKRDLSKWFYVDYDKPEIKDLEKNMDVMAQKYLKTANGDKKRESEIYKDIESIDNEEQYRTKNNDKARNKYIDARLKYEQKIRDEERQVSNEKLFGKMEDDLENYRKSNKISEISGIIDAQKDIWRNGSTPENQKQYADSFYKYALEQAKVYSFEAYDFIKNNKNTKTWYDEAKKMPEKKYDEVLDFLVNYESAVYDLYEQDFWDEDKPFE